jgi:hypothetical protein
MPEFSVKEVRLPEVRRPELHLPEIKRDEIVRLLSGVHLPEVGLARARRAGIKAPAVTLTGADLAKLAAATVAVARYLRPTPSRARWLTGPFGRRLPSPVARIVLPRRRRSRWPIALGAIMVGVVGAWAVLHRPAVRQRVDDVVRRARERLDTWRAAREGRLEVDEDIPIALSAESGAPA